MASEKNRIEGFKDAEKLFKDLLNDGKIAQKAVSAAAPILLEETKKSIHQAISSPPSPRKGGTYSTGALEASFQATEAKENQWGAYSSIGPVGMDTSKKKPIHFAARAAFVEWGTCQGQAPSPWRQRAVNNAKERCEKAMEKTFLEEVGKTWKVEEGEG